MKTLLTSSAIAAILLTAANGASAQTRRRAAAAPAAPAAAPTVNPSPINHGPPIAGMCIYSNNRVLETSAVGKALAARMQQLRAQAAAEVGGEQTALQTDETALRGKRATLSQEQFAQQAQPLAQREQALSQKADLRTRELQATYVQQVQRVGQVIEPIVRQSYEGHHCAVLLNGEAVMAANPAMDLTDEVTTALNGRMSTITFDRASAPAQ